jgi:FAD:protein FMN transferase
VATFSAGSRGDDPLHPPHPPRLRQFKVFGTTAVLLVTDSEMESSAREIADAELAAVDLACSRFRSDSEIVRLNALRGSIMRVSELFAELIAEALRAAELTDGAVDPTVGQALVAAGYDRDFDELTGAGPVRSRRAEPIPGWQNVRFDPVTRHVRLDHGAQLDLGSTAKAWSADRCATKIAADLGVGVLVSLGGDVAVAGPPPSEGWQVKVTDNHAGPADAPGQTVTIRSGGLATSSTTVRTWQAVLARGDDPPEPPAVLARGDDPQQPPAVLARGDDPQQPPAVLARRSDPGEPAATARRMHHIIDPATGAPADSPWRTVSVAAATCADANIASTASIVKGDLAIDWLAAVGLPARLVAHDGTVTLTAGWPTDGHQS